jgi:uncharacterized protein (TIGR02147 family)
MMDEKPSIYTYIDYRSYLGDWYVWMKRKKAGFSYRAFSQWVGMKAPNQLQLIVQRKRNLTSKYVGKFAGVLKLGARERKYFELLIQYDHTSKASEKLFYYHEMGAFWKLSGHHINEGQFEYFSSWFYPALRELVSSPHFRNDPEMIAKLFFEKLSGNQIYKALSQLKAWKLIKVNDQDKLCQNDAYVTSGDAPALLAIYQYHFDMLDQAKASLERDNDKERDFSALTMLINKKQRNTIKEMTATFRQQVISYLNQENIDDSSQQVYQYNIQLFPLTKELKR